MAAASPVPQPEPAEKPAGRKNCMVGACHGTCSHVKWDAYGFWYLDCSSVDWHIGWTKSVADPWIWCNDKRRKKDVRRPWPAHMTTPKQGTSSLPIPSPSPVSSVPAASPRVQSPPRAKAKVGPSSGANAGIALAAAAASSELHSASLGAPESYSGSNAPLLADPHAHAPSEAAAPSESYSAALATPES